MKEYYKELGEYVSFYDDENGLEATKNLDNIEDIFAYQNLIERLEEIIEENELDEEMFNNNNDSLIIKLFKKIKIFIPIRGVLGLIASIIFSQVLLSNVDPNLMLVSSKYLSYMFPSLFAISVGAVDFKDYCDYVKSFKVKNARKVRIETLKKELELAKTKLEELKKESKPVDRVDLQKKEIRDDEFNAAMNIGILLAVDQRSHRLGSPVRGLHLNRDQGTCRSDEEVLFQGRVIPLVVIEFVSRFDQCFADNIFVKRTLIDSEILVGP